MPISKPKPNLLSNSSLIIQHFLTLEQYIMTITSFSPFLQVAHLVLQYTTMHVLVDYFYFVNSTISMTNLFIWIYKYFI